MKIESIFPIFTSGKLFYEDVSLFFFIAANVVELSQLEEEVGAYNVVVNN